MFLQRLGTLAVVSMLPMMAQLHEAATSVGNDNEGALSFTTLASFNGTNGGNPTAGVVQGSAGNFYGTTAGLVLTLGTVYKLTPGGTLTRLQDFSGARPYAGLVQGTDGDFYGTTYYGGTYLNGTVYKITPGGRLRTLHAFTGGADGGFSYAGLVQGSDGNLYGTTSSYGAHGYGTVFRLSVRLKPL